MSDSWGVLKAACVLYGWVFLFWTVWYVPFGESFTYERWFMIPLKVVGFCVLGIVVAVLLEKMLRSIYAD